MALTDTDVLAARPTRLPVSPTIIRSGSESVSIGGSAVVYFSHNNVYNIIRKVVIAVASQCSIVAIIIVMDSFFFHLHRHYAVFEVGFLFQ